MCTLTRKKLLTAGWFYFFGRKGTILLAVREKSQNQRLHMYMYVLAVLRSALPAMPHSIGSPWQPATGLYKSFQSNYPLLFSWCRVTFHLLQSPKCDTQHTAAGVSPQSVCSVMHLHPSGCVVTSSGHLRQQTHSFDVGLTSHCLQEHLWFQQEGRDMKATWKQHETRRGNEMRRGIVTMPAWWAAIHLGLELG